MCGRFSLYASQSEIETELGVELAEAPAPRYNIAPGQPILAVRWTGSARQGLPFRWGLIPAWAKDPKIGSRLINARSETVAEKPSFRVAVRERRCLLPANGFFEWSSGAGKRPFYFLRGDSRLCVFAGLWETWRAPDGSRLASCTILTTRANSVVAPVHERMPVILEPECFSGWLGGDLSTALGLLIPAPETLLVRRAVGVWVNDPRHQGEACVAALRDNAQ